MFPPGGGGGGGGEAGKQLTGCMAMDPKDPKNTRYGCYTSSHPCEGNDACYSDKSYSWATRVKKEPPVKAIAIEDKKILGQDHNCYYGIKDKDGQGATGTIFENCSSKNEKCVPNGTQNGLNIFKCEAQAAPQTAFCTWGGKDQSDGWVQVGDTFCCNKGSCYCVKPSGGAGPSTGGFNTTDGNHNGGKCGTLKVCGGTTCAAGQVCGSRNDTNKPLGRGTYQQISYCKNP